MEQGLHETVVTGGLEHKLSRELKLESTFATVDDADQAHVLLRHVDGVLARRLEAIRDPAKRLSFVNELLGHLQAGDEAVLEPTRELQSLLAATMPDGRLPRYGRRPRTPLNDPALLTNAHGEPSLASELRAELDSSDQVDLLCAFVMWRGRAPPRTLS